jgi:hypothetical protein
MESAVNKSMLALAPMATAWGKIFCGGSTRSLAN